MKIRQRRPNWVDADGDPPTAEGPLAELLEAPWVKQYSEGKRRRPFRQFSVSNDVLIVEYGVQVVNGREICEDSWAVAYITADPENEASQLPVFERPPR